MTKENRFIVGIAAGLFVAATGCAANSAGSGPADQVRIEVGNDLVPSTPVTVFTVDEGGAARRIGFVAGGQVATLSFPVSGGARNYRFRATADAAPPGRTAGRPTFSDDSGPAQPSQPAVITAPIQLGPSSSLVWHLSDNIVFRADP